jgi:xylulokinase
LMVMYGSTMFFIAGSREPARSRGIWTTVGVDPGSLTQAAGTATSGSITAWLRDLFGAGYEELTAAAAAVEPGADGLVALPYFAGERTPVADPRARGVVAGLTLRHGRGHLYRAVLEATAYAARHNLEAFELETVERVAAVGGGASSPLWVQIVSDVSGVEQEIPVETIGASYGDARLAAEAVGLAEPGGSWSRPARVFTPEPGARERYEGLYALYRELHASTREIQHSLAELSSPG